MTDLEHLQYPIGKYEKPAFVTAAQRKSWLKEIESLPQRLEEAIAGMSDEQLDTPYRPGGWTVRQTVHHLADSHLNAYCRVRLTLTEENPVIKPYDQEQWASLPDAEKMPVLHSLEIIKGIHSRWVFILQSLNEGQLKRTYAHPEYGKEYSIEDIISLYAHHGNNHLAQIISLKNRNGW